MTRKQTIYEFLRKMKSLHGMEATYTTEEIANAVGATRIPGMKLTGEGGRIINFSSKSGKTGSALMAPYSAAKGAIIALTHSLAFELVKYKINVNCICPGITDESGVWANVSAGYIKNLSMSRGEVLEEFTAKIPLKRLADISDIVEYVFFLAAEGDYCTGQAINITGGREVH